MNDLLEEVDIKSKIYVIRGKQVMLDSDLAKLYHCKNETKVINQAVNRNINRFPSDFYFQLTRTKYLPPVFTEQGVAMLATVLRTEVASTISIKMMRVFVEMRHNLSLSEFRLTRYFIINDKVYHHGASIDVRV